MSGADVPALLRKVSESPVPQIDDLVSLLAFQDPVEVQQIFDAADETRQRFMGNGILLRGIVEFSSFCSNTCFYCGLHAGNSRLSRYRMSAPEILRSVAAIAAQGIRTVVLQSGEDDSLDPRWLAEVIREITHRHDMAVTLSVGERPLEDYSVWRDAGADRYLLKIESSNEELYRSLHVRRTLETRLRCVDHLFDLGYQVGSGIMVGLRGQDLRHIAEDIRFFTQRDFDMIGIGPFIPHPETRLRGHERGDVWLTLKTVALTRIATKNSHLPATTALGSMERDYRVEGLKAGANVLMPNFTPLEYKKMYEIYPGKRCVSEPTGACGFCMEGLASSIGRTIDHSRGDSRKVRPRVPKLSAERAEAAST
jgi:biotin synthase